MEKTKPLSKVEVDIFMCRLQSAMYENNKEKIKYIIKEAKNRVKELKENGMWYGKD